VRCSGSSPSAAQQSVVVLMLLGLSTVSPKPPSAFRFLASQVRPPRTSSARFFGASARWRRTRSRATTAVAVASALDDSSPSQWPAATRASSSFCRADASVRSTALVPG